MSRFTKINEIFSCLACGREVPLAQKTCRNHCPFCLTSKHVDIFPGDRANPCGGRMDAKAYSLDAKKGIVIHFVCRSCQAETRNYALLDDSLQADDYAAILRLSSISKS